MAFEWRDFFALAQWLHVNSPPECSDDAVRRCAIGRCYYAAYGHALDYATRYLAFTARMASEDHGRLRDHLKRSRRRATADCLDRLREWRNSSDYDIRFSGSLSDIVISSLEEAEYVFKSLEPPKPAAALGTPL